MSCWILFFKNYESLKRATLPYTHQLLLFFTNTDRRQRSCTFCKSTSHTTSKCNVIMDKQKRVEVVKKENLCFNCLGHHKISQCPSKYRCKICKRKHHTSLCDDKNNLKPGTNPEQNNNGTTETEKTLLIPIAQSDNPTHSLMSSSNTKCLLKTAVADV